MRTLYLLYLDRHHLGDDLFLKSLAQHFAKGPGGEPPCVLVHGSGEKVERTLESQGVFPERSNGVLDVEGEEQRRLVERAVREVNQEIVAALTDEVVSTVGIQGVDRGLLGRDESGALVAQNAGWIATLVKQRVLPVVSALLEEERVEEVWAADVAVALADALRDDFDPVACALTTNDRAGLSEDGGIRAEAPLDAVTEEDVPNREAIHRLHAAGLPVLLTSLQGLFDDEGPRGTRIAAAEASA